MLYPLKFKPIYKQIIWGGKNIEKVFGRKTPFEKTAESWELCERPDGMGIVENGGLAGRTFADIIDEYGEKLLGKASIKKYGGRFPLLIKIIDANGKLSVQVHPDDAYAESKGEKNGKNELWYIIDAKPGAKLVYGLNDGVSKEDFAKAVKDGTVENTLREVPVKAGDAFYIPAGTVHAILDGILIAEIQQNSNTTYRIYDWGRMGADGKPRALHVKEALDVIAFEKSLPKPPQKTGGTRDIIRHCEFFNIDRINLDGIFSGEANGETFYVLMNFGGTVSVRYDGGKTDLASGETVLLPACLGKYTVDGQSKLLLSWI